MTGSEPLADRRPDEPHPSRLSHDDPRYTEIMAAHQAARAAGQPGYADPATGYLVMTADYLVGRGECCAQGCRHCPYLA